MSHSYQYLFGPVPSRRLGLSLGVDLVPFKTCTLDCIYCQVGYTTCLTTERKVYHPITEILTELERRLAELDQVDYITLSGSGEPTLHSQLGALIDGIKVRWTIPVAVITNGTLLWRPDVRQDCQAADLVMPSLDAVDETTFAQISGPSPELSLDKILTGLRDFRASYSGHFWLEVFLIEGINTHAQHIAHLKEVITEIAPERVQLNTAVRPTAQAGIAPLSPERLEDIRYQLGLDSEILTRSTADAAVRTTGNLDEAIHAMLQRRPCCLADICASLGLEPPVAQASLERLSRSGQVSTDYRSGTLYYRTL